MTQYELADRVRRTRPKLKLTEARISRYERNAQIPRIAVLVAIAEETGQSLDFFRIDSDGGPDEVASSSDEEEDSAAMQRAAYQLDRVGQFAIADDLRRRARRVAMQAARRERVT